MSKIESYANAGTPTLSDKLIGTEVGATPANATKNFTTGQLLTLFNANDVPASAAATGTAGMIAADATHLYICVTTNKWKRVAISTF